jgi:hypothetical protein
LVGDERYVSLTRTYLIPRPAQRVSLRAVREEGSAVVDRRDPRDRLKKNVVQVDYFTPELTQEVERGNKAFIEHHLHVSPIDRASRRLDDHFYTINSVYFDRNYHRDASSIFTHLVEIMGGLSLLATMKQKQGVVPESYVPKAIAWWLALCGKVGIRSVEDLLWSKFPYACAYCMQCPHNDRGLHDDGGGPDALQMRQRRLSSPKHDRLRGHRR